MLTNTVQITQIMLFTFGERTMDMSNERFSCVNLKYNVIDYGTPCTKYQLLFLIMSVVWQILPSVHSVVLIAAIKAAVIFSG